MTSNYYYIIEIDECENKNCGENSTCIDQMNGYECQCNEGFESDGGLSCSGTFLIFIINMDGLLLIMLQKMMNVRITIAVWIQHASTSWMILNACAIPDLMEMALFEWYNLSSFFHFHSSYFHCFNNYFIEIFECSKCSGNATCRPTSEVFECDCNEGFSGDGFDCSGLIWERRGKRRGEKRRGGKKERGSEKE